MNVRDRRNRPSRGGDGQGVNLRVRPVLAALVAGALGAAMLEYCTRTGQSVSDCAAG